MLIMSAMEHQFNGERVTNSQRGSPSPDLVGMPEQVLPDRIQTAHNGIRGGTRRKWSKNDNKIAMDCYIKSEPDKRGYRRRMISLWQDKGMFEISEQRLADQISTIKRNQWLTNVEIEEMRRIVQAESDGTDIVNHQIPEEAAAASSQSEDEVNQPGLRNGQDDDGIDDEEGVEFTEEEVQIKARLQEVMEAAKGSNGWSIPALRRVPRKRLTEMSAVVSKVLGSVSKDNLSETNRLIFAGAVVVGEKLGVEVSQQGNSTPWWKRRLEGQIKDLRRDLSRIEQMNKGLLNSSDLRNTIMTKYNVKRKGVSVVIEEIKQRVKAKAAKVKRYDDRVRQFHQNRLFNTNQRQLFKELDGKVDSTQAVPRPTEAKTFWGGIWDKPVKHNRQAEWLTDVKDELRGVQQQEGFQIDVDKVKRQIKKVPNWKAPGMDHVHGYWLKNFRSLHERMALQLQDCLVQGKVPSWMTEAKTVLIMKDVKKGNIASNYRPITCLPVMYKLLTSMIAEDLYRHMDDQQLFPEEQKGCKKRSRGTKDQLIIDKAVLKDCRSRKTNLAMAWIDYKKAYDMVSHTWIMECLDMVGVADAVKRLLGESMKTWRTNLTANDDNLGKVCIRRGISQGDSLSPLLFVLAMMPLSMILRKVSAGYVMKKDGCKINHLLFMDDLKLFAKNEAEIDSLVQTVRIFSDDIGMQFGLEKCASMTMKRGKRVHSDGIALPDGAQLRALGEEESYRYLGVLESDHVLHKESKVRLKAEYIRRVKKCLKSKLNGGNMIKAINTWAVSLMRYSAGIVEWTKEDLDVTDRRTRKLMTMHGMLHPRSNVSRLYLPRSEGGRGLLSVADSVNIERRSLHCHVRRTEESLLKVAQRYTRADEVGPKEYKRERKEERHQDWRNKPLHGRFLRCTEEVASSKSWNWLKSGELKKETEGLITAAQDQSLRTNVMKARIEKANVSPMCRMCNKAEETVFHIVSECSKMAQTEYKGRHDKLAKVIHWDLCKKYGVKVLAKWYDHVPEKVVENDQVKILWDFNIQTDHVIQHRRPDVVLLDKTKKMCHLIDIAVPGDIRVASKEMEKIEKYQDLARELRKIWQVKVKVVPVVVGALGTIPKALGKHLDEIGTNVRVDLLQKAALLGTARILRKTLEI